MVFSAGEYIYKSVYIKWANKLMWRDNIKTFFNTDKLIKAVRNGRFCIKISEFALYLKTKRNNNNNNIYNHKRAAVFPLVCRIAVPKEKQSVILCTLHKCVAITFALIPPV